MDTIICPNCNTPIPLSDALSHEVQEKYRKFYKIRLAEETAKLTDSLKEKLTREIAGKMELDLKDKNNELDELKKQNKNLSDQLMELNRTLRQMNTEMNQQKLELEKKLLEGQEKIRNEEKTRIDEEYKFKILEKEKQLEDARKMVDDYKRKLEQGSQQLQGEVMELEIENVLKREFASDVIKEVPKGVRGADVMQTVKNSYGRICGTIVWESKRTKAWSDTWLFKLKQDQRELKAEIAVIITEALPEGIKNFGLYEGIWITNFESMTGLATALRAALMDVASVKISNKNRQNKMEVLYEYFCGLEFKQRIEAITDAYNQMQEDIEKEKRWFSAKWAKEEKNMRNVFDNLTGMYGDLQGMMGKALPEVKGLEMLPESVQEEII